MRKPTAKETQPLKRLQAELKELQIKLKVAQAREGNNSYIEVKKKKSQGRFERTKQKGKADRLSAAYYLEIDITAREAEVFVPISIASGKKVAGFMYQIEGTDEGSLLSATIKVRGEKVTQVRVGTLRYARVPLGATASFIIQAEIRGKQGKSYTIVITRLNYKLQLTDARYQQYRREIVSEKVKFS